MNHKTTISDIFSPRKISFAVPNYQRAYSWEVGEDHDRHVPQFFHDLKEHPAAVPKYHLGHFLFEQDSADESRFWIIDGQQRMTTIVIFMSCIYRRLNLENNEDRNAINIYNDYMVNTDGQQKFRTVDYDNNYFLNTIIENRSDEINTKSRKRMMECKAYLQNEIDKASIEDLMRWKLLVENASITTDTISDKAEATQVFTFQNDRGKALTNLERLKAFLMLQIYLTCKSAEINPNEAIHFIEKEFEAIYERLEKLNIADEDQVLNYHTTAFLALDGTAITRIRNAFKQVRIDQRHGWIMNFTVNLKKSFGLIIDIQDHLDKAGYIADILHLDQANSLPLLLKLFHLHTIAEEHNLTLRLMEIILFRCNYTTGNYYTNYLPNLALSYNGDLPQLNEQLFLYAKKGFKPYWSFEGAFHQYLEGDNHYYGLSRYLLWKYENYLRTQVRESPMLYPEFANRYGTSQKLENTIDHWAPQNPHEIEYEQEFNAKYLNNIGNMVLSTRSRNSSDSNKLPAQRITTSVLISRQQLEPLKDTWGKDAIKARHKEIVSFAVSYWDPELVN